MSIGSEEDIQDGEMSLSFYDDRDLILSKLNEAIDYLHKKALTGRINDAKNEKVRIAWFKALAYACSIYNQIKKDIELDDLREEMETLRDQIRNMENK